MKKTLSSVLAAAMTVGAAVTAFAAPVYDPEGSQTLKNTITGFRGGETSAEADVTQMGGSVDVQFDLGDNAPYYAVEFDVTEGGRQVSAVYNQKKKAITIQPNVSPNQTEAKDYTIEFEVVDRKTSDVIADGYAITGTVAFDTIQYADSDKRYLNDRGALYDFSGAENVEIDAGNDVTVRIAKAPRGVVNMRLTTDSNESLDYMFSKHELDYLNFVGKPKFSVPAEVIIDAPEALYLYEYSGDVLRKVPGAQYDENAGFVFRTKQLSTYILADHPLNEGIVDESKNLIRPVGGNGNSAGAGGDTESKFPEKNNPTTGAAAADLNRMLLAAMSLTGVGLFVSRKYK